MPPTKQKQPSLASRIVGELEEEILRGARTPGERLDERALAERYQVSRTPVREALQRLAASGLVTLHERQGASVARLSLPDLLDAFQVVAELEGLAASQAARRIQPGQRQALQNHHEDCTDFAGKAEVDGFYEANLRFHETILEASHNWVLQEQMRGLRLLTSPYRRHITFQPGRMARSIPEHAAVLEAILAGDAPGAGATMRQHVTLLAEGVADFLHCLRLAGAGQILDPGER